MIPIRWWGYGEGQNLELKKFERGGGLAGVWQGVISIRLGAGPARYASSSSSPLERLRWSSGVLAVEVDRPVPADLLVDLPAEG